MRRIYLCRHGMPAFPQGEKCCIGGGSDPALSPAGRMQACILGLELHGRGPLRVFHSGMRRAAQTAAYLSEQARPLPAFRELDMGQWEGLTFDAIRRRFPEEYARRGEDPAQYPPPGGESLAAAASRAAEGLRALLADTEGDLAVVAHAGVIRLLLCAAGGAPLGAFLRFSLPYGCYYVLTWDGAHLRAEEAPRRPEPVPSAETCRALLRAAGAPTAVADHCAAAADLARALCAKVGGDGDLAFRAAALHDIAKGCPDHPRAGADWLRSVGWDAEADIVARHQDLGPDASPEAKAVYLADKLLRGTERVSLAARFAASLEKCTTPEARAAHDRRAAEAFRLAAEFHLQETAPENSC